MQTSYKFNRNQLIALCSVTLRAAWLSVPAAALPLLGYVWFLSRFMSHRKSGEGMAELTLRCLGSGAGGAALLTLSLWMLLYAGFILRSGAERMVTMIYPDSSPARPARSCGLQSSCSRSFSARSACSCCSR